MINYKFDKYLNSDLRLMQLFDDDDFYAFYTHGTEAMLPENYNKSTSELWNNANKRLHDATSTTLLNKYNVGNMSRRDMRRFRKDMGWNKALMRDFVSRSSDGNFDEQDLRAVNIGNGITKKQYKLARRLAGNTKFDFRNNRGVLDFIKNQLATNERIGGERAAFYNDAVNEYNDFVKKWELSYGKKPKTTADILNSDYYDWDDIKDSTEYEDFYNMLKSQYAGSEEFDDNKAKEVYEKFTNPLPESGFQEMEEQRKYGFKDGRFTYTGAKGTFAYDPSTNSWYNGKHKLDLTKGKSNINKDYYVRGWYKQGGQLNKFQTGGQVASKRSAEDLLEKALVYATLGMIGYAASQLKPIDFTTAVAEVMQYGQSEEGMKQLQLIAGNTELVKAGMEIMKQKEPEMLQLISQPGGFKQVLAQIEQLKNQQQTTMAKQGTKLSYINSLKGICPEGYEMSYMKAGGKMCPVCKKKVKINKDCGGVKMKMHATGGISEMMNQIKTDLLACGGKMKKVKKAEEGSKVDVKKRPTTYNKAAHERLIKEFEKNGRSFKGWTPLKKDSLQTYNKLMPDDGV